jgi:hypothetical protein
LRFAGFNLGVGGFLAGVVKLQSNTDGTVSLVRHLIPVRVLVKSLGLKCDEQTFVWGFTCNDHKTMHLFKLAIHN